MPFPVSDFFQILSIFSDVLLVLNQFVVHLLNQDDPLLPSCADA